MEAKKENSNNSTVQDMDVSFSEKRSSWFRVCSAEDVPQNGGVCVQYKQEQIALFNFARRDEWHATQNLCPHRMQMVLSRGLIGSQNGEPKIACPFHKKTFSLIDGRCINDNECSIKIYPVKVENNYVYINVDGTNGNDALLA